VLQIRELAGWWVMAGGLGIASTMWSPGVGRCVSGSNVNHDNIDFWECKRNVRVIYICCGNVGWGEIGAAGSVWE